VRKPQYEFYSSPNQKIIDAMIAGVSFYLAYQIRFEWHAPPVSACQLWLLLPAAMLGRVTVTALPGTHRQIWRYVSLADAICATRNYTVFSAILLALRLGAPLSLSILRLPLSVITIEFLFSVEGALGARALRRFLYESQAAKALKGKHGGRALRPLPCSAS